MFSSRPRSSTRLQQYIATVKPYRWHKGAHLDSLSVEGAVAIDALPPGFVPSPPLPRGWRGKVYLVKSGKNLFGLASSNAVFEDKRSSTPNDLPRCGEIGDAAPAAAVSATDPTPPNPPTPIGGTTDAAITGEASKSGSHDARGCNGCAARDGDGTDFVPLLIGALAILIRINRRRSSII
jgi:hypothetical protein